MKNSWIMGLLLLLLAFAENPESAAPNLAIKENPTAEPYQFAVLESLWERLLDLMFLGPENTGYGLPVTFDYASFTQGEQQQKTEQLLKLVKDAAKLVQEKGEAAFKEFRVTGNRWRRGESYIFVLDLKGNVLVHPDLKEEGTNQLNLTDNKGRPFIRGLLDEVTALPEKPEGWYHYQWVLPGEKTPRWKSTYARLVKAPSGKSYVIASGEYSEKMEKPFVIDLVKNAVGELEKRGVAAFPVFRDPAGPYRVKDAYLLVIDMDGMELVNPAFPEYEGKKVLDYKDSKGKPFIREMLQTVQKNGDGWVNYMWPKPGETAPSQKSTYVHKARLENKWVLVGCGVYLDKPDTPKTKK